MLSFLGALAVGLGLIALSLFISTVRFALQARLGVPVHPPVSVQPGSAIKLIRAAITGNKDLLLIAAQDALRIWIEDGSLEEKLLELSFDDTQRRLNDPNGQAPVIKTIAHLVGMSEQQVFDALKAEFLPDHKPATPAVAVPAIALFLCLAVGSSALGASPLRTPDKWYPTEQKIVLDSPTFYTPVSVTNRDQILLPNKDYKPIDHRDQLKYGDNLAPNGWYQPVYYARNDCYAQNVGFWQAGSVRRGTVRVFGAPFRFFGRLFGRRC